MCRSYALDQNERGSVGKCDSEGFRIIGHERAVQSLCQRYDSPDRTWGIDVSTLRISRFVALTLLLSLGYMRLVSGASAVYTQPGIQIVGLGCTTAFYLDPLCKPCGVGMKSSGKYPVNPDPPAEGSPAFYTMGDMPDADPNDPNVCTTAQWEAKWGWSTPASASDNGAMVKYLQQDMDFTNTSRIFYIAMNGNDSTAVMNDPSHPYATMAAIKFGANGNPGIDDNQGGVVIIEGGYWGAPGNPSLNLDPCDPANNACWELSGSPGHPLLVMGFPGEVVQTENGLTATGTYRPGKNACCMTVDGLEFWDAQYGAGGFGAIAVADYADITVENSEFAGWDKIIFSNDVQNALVKNNVFHDMLHHAVYFAFTSGIIQSGDFNFALDHANFLRGASMGASYHGQIIGNVMYGNGNHGYEPIHVNTYIDYPVIEGNIISYSGGTGIGLYTGVYHAFVADNLLFDNGRDCITLFLYDPAVNPPAANALRWNTIENNTCYVGKPSDSIQGTSPMGGILQNDGTSTSGHYIKDTTITNNIIVTYDTGGGTGQLPLKFETNSYPETDTIQGNIFWSTGPTTGRVMVISSGASPNAEAGTYSFAQFQAFSPNFSGNQYANPQFKSASPDYSLTPGLFNFGVSETIAAANVGANFTDLLTPPTPPPWPPDSGVLPSPPSRFKVK
jgi:hypothetical protein